MVNWLSYLKGRLICMLVLCSGQLGVERAGAGGAGEYR